MGSEKRLTKSGVFSRFDEGVDVHEVYDATPISMLKQCVQVCFRRVENRNFPKRSEFLRSR
jgi:hypothetical protein